VNAETRQEQILKQLADHGHATIADLSARFDVSEMTVRRDIGQLAAAGLVIRTHGGAAPSTSSSFEPPFALRTRSHAEEKRQIAAAIEGQVIDGQTLILDGGSTGVAIAERLVGRRITVCTLNLRAAEILSADAATRVMIPAGTIRTGELSIVGPEVQETLRRFRFDTFIMTASAANASAGYTEWNSEDATTKRVALEVSRRTIAAVDSSKFGQQAFAQICDLGDVDLLVTDRALSTEHTQHLSVATAEVIYA